ncbi:hypothetical protein CCR75_000819 [Bremia lactucae]|uniref:Uncharacterized protein n=1 Tax=Bremia lactucae TaxID=4779 RepID=A0A976IFR7_BRELC|nr:hypothetical protein CCR75_000819 [Bremia lactucae]
MASTASKRKRLKNLNPMATSTAFPSIEDKFQTLEMWYRALNVDMSELRRECARVRLELEKVDDTAEAAVEKSERCLVKVKKIQERAILALEAKDKAAESSKSSHEMMLDHVDKRFITMHKKLAKFRQGSINEEFLMTQLTQLQEQYEDELMKLRQEQNAKLEAQQSQLKRVMVQFQADKTLQKEIKTMKKIIQRLTDENNRLTHEVAQMVTHKEVDTLRQHVVNLENATQEEKGCKRGSWGTFKNQVVDNESQKTEMESRLLNTANGGDESTATTLRLERNLLPLCLPRDVVRQKDLSGIYEDLRRINHDFQSVDADISSLVKQSDTRGSQQEQHFEARIQELSTQLFNALGHDSRLHATEIGRLKDALFDSQSNQRELTQWIRRVEDQLHQLPQARPQDQPVWCSGPDQPEYIPLAPSIATCREKTSSYELVHNDSVPSLDPNAHDSIQWDISQRGRSRSPLRRRPWSSNLPRSETTTDSNYHLNHSQRDNQRRDFGGVENHEHVERHETEVAEMPSNNLSLIPSTHDKENNVAERSSRYGQFDQISRRSRQPRKIPEVIVIEEDEDDDDVSDDLGDESVYEEVDGARAPPDVVLDEEDTMQSPNVIAAYPPETRSLNTNEEEIIDVLENESDVRTGLLLYFCLGGAPDLDVYWTHCFTQLNSEECVDLSRVFRFQRQYVFLQCFPLHLTQCILQAMASNGQSGCKKIKSRISEAITATQLRDNFDDVVTTTRLSWIKALNIYLSEQAQSSDESLSEGLVLSLNPAALSCSLDEDVAISAWRRRQGYVLWNLVRTLHYGSFLPAMKCNADTSPAVYLFVLLFDVLTVTSLCPQFGSFRLNAFGSKAFAFLWNSTLKKLPYVCFADWSWLEDQSTGGKLPALAFCHLLATILLSNSPMDHYCQTSCKNYAAVVKHILCKLYVGGQAIQKSVDTVPSTSLMLAEWEITHIELHDLDSTFASILGLDGFFEVTEAIQNNMLAMAATKLSS